MKEDMGRTKNVLFIKNISLLPLEIESDSIKIGSDIMKKIIKLAAYE
jgi:hypothetical protein